MVPTHIVFAYSTEIIMYTESMFFIEISLISTDIVKSTYSTESIMSAEFTVFPRISVIPTDTIKSTQ